MFVQLNKSAFTPIVLIWSLQQESSKQNCSVVDVSSELVAQRAKRPGL